MPRGGDPERPRPSWIRSAIFWRSLREGDDSDFFTVTTRGKPPLSEQYARAREGEAPRNGRGRQEQTRPAGNCTDNAREAVSSWTHLRGRANSDLLAVTTRGSASPANSTRPRADDGTGRNGLQRLEACAPNFCTRSHARETRISGRVYVRANGLAPGDFGTRSHAQAAAALAGVSRQLRAGAREARRVLSGHKKRARPAPQAVARTLPAMPRAARPVSACRDPMACRYHRRTSLPTTILSPLRRSDVAGCRKVDLGPVFRPSATRPPPEAAGAAVLSPPLWRSRAQTLRLRIL